MAAVDTHLNSTVHLEERIRKLNAIGIALSSEHDLNKLLELIVKEARSFTNADGGSLYIKEEDKLKFAVAQTSSLEARKNQQQSFKSFYLPLTKESIAGYVAVTGELLNIKDVYHIPPTVEYRFNKQFDIKSGYRSKSMLVVPMRDHSDEIIGVLQLINSWNADGEVVPFKAEYEDLILSLASQAAVAIRNAKLIAEIKNLFRSLVRYSAKAIDARSPHTAGHSGRVAKYSVRMAQAINEETNGRLGAIHFTPEEIEELRMAGWLHDIGKIGVRESVLEKTTKLTNNQINVICERFENIKRWKQTQFLETKLKLMMGGNHTTEVERLSCNLRKEMTQLDDDLEFIKRINMPGFLKEKDRTRLKNIAEKTYTNCGGEECFYLKPLEYENLSIIKGNLTPSEYKEIQAHVEHTLSILNKIPFTKDLQNIPKHSGAHHEYLNGTGYPKGLKGDEITIQSRVMCIADIYDALSSPDRPYKKAIPLERTLEILRGEAKAGKLDSDLVELFIRKKLYQRPSLEEEEE
ncbi:GAF domain-containing protein [candidate division KSB1 bacterium]|nr:GAF domain-containing protein [candidate division KSB1 bacterium]NIR73006.1 GAF domain-containing protein [candidate division KSB1 bacterium]NIS28280.1 GAF domain-containing protein [candidate division KSB1 bacterium]NIT75152.1 GAF domain-containing protein [candidate division KSB1 bacterium]NIU28959.1 GAF domain-containing protein [candidate division KSB1 bacterium]